MVFVRSHINYISVSLDLQYQTSQTAEWFASVYFEEQNIHTQSGDGELMLTILASYAQEESRSASENCLWRIKERFKNGEPVGFFTMFGYRFEGGRPRRCADKEREVHGGGLF
jgi:DNA invertase Pin-like site-specific DNA recombinase